MDEKILVILDGIDKIFNLKKFNWPIWQIRHPPLKLSGLFCFLDIQKSIETLGLRKFKMADKIFGLRKFNMADLFLFFWHSKMGWPNSGLIKFKIADPFLLV